MKLAIVEGGQEGLAEWSLVRPAEDDFVVNGWRSRAGELRLKCLWGGIADLSGAGIPRFASE
jgi:hypothetical protein